MTIVRQLACNSDSCKVTVKPFYINLPKSSVATFSTSTGTSRMTVTISVKILSIESAEIVNIQESPFQQAQLCPEK